MRMAEDTIATVMAHTGNNPTQVFLNMLSSLNINDKIAGAPMMSLPAIISTFFTTSLPSRWTGDYFLLQPGTTHSEYSI
jgi:hypothetical protein